MYPRICLFVCVLLSFYTEQISARCYHKDTTPTERYSIQYFFKTNWYDALHFCRYIGMDLATISSEADQIALKTRLTHLGLLDERFWIGGNDLSSEGKFSWSSSGGRMSNEYSNWLPGQPDNAGRIEHCVEIWHNQGWNDNQCGNQFYFVCERN